MAFTPFVETDLPTMANFNEKFLQAIREGKEQALGEGVKIETGSYVGTGTYGVENPNSLTFGFVPKIVFVYREPYGVYPRYFSSSGGWPGGAFIWLPGQTQIYTVINATEIVEISQNGHTLSWYAPNTPSAQANLLNTTYHYLAIG